MNEEIKVGDEVIIVMYGHLTMDYNVQGGLESKDTWPSLLGKCGAVDRIIGNKYYIKGLPKYGPYNKEQLKKK